MATNIKQGWQSEKIEDSGIAHRILRPIFKNYSGSFLIKFWDDSMLRVGNEASAFTLRLKHAKVPRDLVLYRDPIRLAEAYFDGAVEVEGDFNAAMGLRYYLENLQLPLRCKLGLVFRALTLNSGKPKHNADSNRANSLPRQNDEDSIAFHYDVSNDFYQLWLDAHMVYSCAYFDSPELDIDTAQRNKLD